MNKRLNRLAISLSVLGLLLLATQKADSQSKEQMLKDFFYAGTMHGWQMNRPYLYPYYSAYPSWSPWYGYYGGIYPPYAYGPYSHPHGYPPSVFGPGAYGFGMYPPPRYDDKGSSPYAHLQVKPAGQLTVLVDPVDAEVRVDGKKLKQMDDLSFQVGLLVGTHKVEASKDGYRPFTTDIEIRAGGGIFLPIQLTKK